MNEESSTSNETSGLYSSATDVTCLTSDDPFQQESSVGQKRGSSQEKEQHNSRRRRSFSSRRTREGQFRNPDHYRLAKPAVVVHTYLTPGLGRRIPVDDEDAVMVHFVFEREVERGANLSKKSLNDSNLKSAKLPPKP